jgi:putative tricarboxylic transport membrane protein
LICSLHVGSEFAAQGKAANMSSSSTRPWWLGLGIMAIGGIWLNGAFSLDVVANYGGIGPGLFVGLVGSGLVLLGLLLTIKIGHGERFEPQATEDMTPDAPFSRSGFLLATAAAAVPLATMLPVGFPVTAALVFTLVARAFGTRRIVQDLVFGLILGSACWYGFRSLGVDLGGFLPLVGW